jgi:hypothetical protein
MGNQQLMQMKSLFASIKERISNPNVDLATARDIVESLHLATAEAEGVTYISSSPRSDHRAIQPVHREGP